MIREEYEKQLQQKSGEKNNVTVRKMSKREKKKRAELGDRGYIGKTVNDTADLKKAVKFSSIFVLVVAILCFGLYSLVYFSTKESKIGFIISASAVGAVMVWVIVWFAIIVPMLNRKVERLKEELTRLMDEEKRKQMLRYERYKKYSSSEK